MMRSRLLVPVLVTLAIVAVTGCAPATTGAADDPLQAPSALRAIEAGQQLPPLSLRVLDGEGTVTTRDLEGRPLVLNFWATWCAFCVEEMPDVQAVHRRLGDAVRFVGVDVEDDTDKARTFAQRLGITYDLLVDPDRSALHGVTGRNVMPATVLVDADGTIVHRHLGVLDAELLEDLIREHLDIAA